MPISTVSSWKLRNSKRGTVLENIRIGTTRISVAGFALSFTDRFEEKDKYIFAAYLFRMNSIARVITDMLKNKKESKQILADRQIQGGLCVRVAIYWLASLFLTLSVVAGVSYLETGNFDDSFRFLLPALIAGVMTLPLAVSDMLTFSNRFAGPLLNFRRKFHQMSKGQSSDKLVLRPGDFLEDISDDYNQMRELLSRENQSNSDAGVEISKTDELHKV